MKKSYSKSNRKTKCNKKRNVRYRKCNSTAKLTIEEKIIKRAKYQAKKDKDKNLKPLVVDVANSLAECKEKAASLLFYHYYLTVVQEMVEYKVIEDVPATRYDVVKYTKHFKEINQNIDAVLLLEEIELAQIQFVYVAEMIKKLGEVICDKIVEVEPYNSTINQCIYARMEKYKKERDTEEPEHEMFNQVVRISALNYMAEKLIKKDQKETTVVNPNQSGETDV